MQIISGQAKGINLKVPDGFEVRPTGVRARKALFDSINNFKGLKIIDLFAGSGALGLEAASRGASSVTFVELADKNCKGLEENIERVLRTKIQCEFKLLCGNAANPNILTSIMPGTDILFADPPYEKSPGYLNDLVTNQSFIDSAAGILIIWEIPGDVRDYSPYHIKGPWLSQRRRFGSTEFLLLKRPEAK